MGTRDVARLIESMFGSHYSATTVSNITATVLEDIQQWQKRPLNKRYSVIYLDGLYVKLKRGTVSGEVVYFAMGIDEEGHRQILGFYVGGQESANGWREVLKDLYSRGVHEVLRVYLTVCRDWIPPSVKPTPRRMCSTASSTKSVEPFLIFGSSTRPIFLKI